MTDLRRERTAAQRNSQIITALYSVVFVLLIASGYFLLFERSLFVAVLAAIILSGLAWFLARFIGSKREGIRGHIPLFALLLVVSAFGVFNTLMLNLEGREIFKETINDTYDRFDKLKLRATQQLAKGGGDSPLAHMRRVAGLKAALFSEIRNPLNCGQGPEARRIVGDLRAELPEFRPLSEKTVDCSQNAKVIDDYDKRIGDAVQRATWNDPGLLRAIADASTALNDLDALRKTSSSSFVLSLLSDVKPALETKSTQYRDIYQIVDATGEINLPSQLDLQQVESLGEWNLLPYLFLGRLGKPTTWLYLVLAVGADWMMVYLFALVRTNRRSTAGGDTLGSGVGRAF